MTIVCIYKESSDLLWVLADSRLTASLNRRSVLTDRMPKIFVATVKLHNETSGGVSFLSSSDVGIAFAGSANMAFATISTLQAYLLSLVVSRDSNDIALYDISEFCRRILCENYIEFGGVADSRCSIFLFGSLPTDSDLKCYEIAHCKGSGSGNLVSRLREAVASGVAQKTGIAEIMSAMILEGSNGVGGSLQVAQASRRDVKLPEVLRRNTAKNDGTWSRSFLGRPSDQYGSIENSRLGVVAVAIPPPKFPS